MRGLLVYRHDGSQRWCWHIVGVPGVICHGYGSYRYQRDAMRAGKRALKRMGKLEVHA